MTRWIFGILMLTNFAMAQEFSGPSIEELNQRDEDRLNYLKEKKRIRDERYKAWFEHVEWRKALEAEQERTRLEYVAERDSRPTRSPASDEAENDRKRHKAEKRMVASIREKARQQYIYERELNRAQHKKSVRRDLRRQIQTLEQELESD